MDNYELRLIGKCDYKSQYFSLLRQLTSCNEERITKKVFEDFIDSLHEKHQIWLIIEKVSQKIVGTGTLFIEQKIIHDMGKVGHIEDIVIDSMCRGVGLGEMLIRHLKNICLNAGCYKVILDCSDDRMTFYQRCGFGKKGIMMDSRV